MKGVIFNGLENFITKHHGQALYEEVLDSCKLQSKCPFVGSGTYPDEDLVEIFSKTIRRLEAPSDPTMKAFGDHLFGELAKKYPVFLEGQNSLKKFLYYVDEVIHVEVRKLYPDAVTPKFTYQEEQQDHLKIIYESPRKMPNLMAGLIEGAARFFNEKIEYSFKPVAGESDQFEFDIMFKVSI